MHFVCFISPVNDIKKEDAQFVRWPDVQAAFRKKGCVYLYVSPAKALLLPDGQADAPDAAVWAYLKEHMAEKCKE